MFVLLLVAASVPIGVSAAQEKRPLTNDDIVSMVRAGLDEGTVILAVENTPSHFDTSPEALVRLKEHGASPKVLNAMFVYSAVKSGPAPKLEVSGSSPIPGLPSGEGAYTKRGDEFIRLELLSPAGTRTKMGLGKRIATMAYWGGVTVVNRYRGGKAPAQVSEAKPTFYLRTKDSEANTRNALIVKLDKKKGSSGTLHRRFRRLHWSKVEIRV
jgi:hypothetical protein